MWIPRKSTRASRKALLDLSTSNHPLLSLPYSLKSLVCLASDLKRKGNRCVFLKPKTFTSQTKNSFRQDFLPTILGRVRGQTAYRNGSPGIWRKSLECLGVGEIPVFPGVSWPIARGNLASSLRRTIGHPV